MTKHLETCSSCKDNKCEIRDSCPDDETTTIKQPGELYENQITPDGIGKLTLVQ